MLPSIAYKYELLRARCIDNSSNEPVCKKPKKNNHKGCSEWLHGNGSEKPCTFIVIAPGNDNNKVTKMLRKLKSKGKDSLDIETGDDCKIVLTDDLIQTCNNNRKTKSKGGGKSNDKLLKKYSTKYYKLSKKRQKN